MAIAVTTTSEAIRLLLCMLNLLNLLNRVNPLNPLTGSFSRFYRLASVCCTSGVVSDDDVWHERGLLPEAHAVSHRLGSVGHAHSERRVIARSEHLVVDRCSCTRQEPTAGVEDEDDRDETGARDGVRSDSGRCPTPTDITGAVGEAPAARAARSRAATTAAGVAPVCRVLTAYRSSALRPRCPPR